MEENKTTPEAPKPDLTTTTAPPPPAGMPDINPQPIPAPAITPDETPPPITGKSPNTKKIILIAVGVLVFLIVVIGAILVIPKLMSPAVTTPEPTLVPTPKVVVPKPDEMATIIASVPIEENTISAAKTGGQYFISYKDQFYVPRDTGSDNQELESVDLEDPESYTWHGLVDVPEGEIFDFVQLPEVNPGFSFIVRQQGVDGERYVLYYFAFNELSQTAEFTVDPTTLVYRIPKFYSINSAGTLAALHMYDCWECERHYPQTNVINFITKEMQILGPTSYFAWDTDENFEYKEYVPNTDPATLPLKTGSFKFTNTPVATPRSTATPRPSATPASQ